MRSNYSRDFWSNERRIQLRVLAASGMPAIEIAATIGTTKLSILNQCRRHGIDVTVQTPAEREAAKAVEREKNRRKQAAWQAKQKANKPAVTNRTAPGTSRTHPIYRNQLPRLADGTSKEALRRMISEAVRNTAEMST